MVLARGVRGARRPVRLAVLALLGALALAGCGEDTPDQGTNTDPDQVDAVETPELGACRDLTPDDVTLATNATRTVDCAEPHTAETYAVGQLPEQFDDADYDDGELGRFAYKTCGKKFMAFLGADESLVMRTVRELGVVPSVGEGVGRGRPVVPLRRRRRRRRQRRRTSTCPRPPRACCSGGPTTVDGLRDGPSVDGTEGPLLRAAHLARGHHDQGRRARDDVPRRPAGRGQVPRVLLRLGRAPG